MQKGNAGRCQYAGVTSFNALIWTSRKAHLNLASCRCRRAVAGLDRKAEKPRQIGFLRSFNEAVEIMRKGFDRVVARTYMSGPARRGAEPRRAVCSLTST